MRACFLVAALLVFSMAFPVTGLDAASDLRTAPFVIEQHFQQLEEALNNRRQPMQKVHVLHEQISDNAVFHMTVDNPALSAAQNDTGFEMGKADYINSFLLGGQHIADYKASIQVVSIDPDQRSGNVTSVILLEESGAVLDPFFTGRRGRDFLSRTVCTSVHGRNLQIMSSACDTAVSYQNPV